LFAKHNSTKYGQPSRQHHRHSSSERQITYLIVGTALLFTLLIASIVFLNIQRSQPVSGEETVATLGNAHIAQNTVATAAYNSTPPTSGPHYGSIAEWGGYTEPLPYEVLLHNMEDGGVIVYYQCPGGCPETVGALTEIVNAYVDGGRRVILAPNAPSWSSGVTHHKDMGAIIAVTAWNRILKMDEVNAERIRTFIQKYQGIDHHGIGG
jgi:hypothetical protein